jgi:hypothetical protein
VIRWVSIFINSSHYESFTWSSAIFSRYQSKIKLLTIQINTLEVGKSENTWSSERYILTLLELFKHAMIESKMGDILSRVWELSLSEIIS